MRRALLLAVLVSLAGCLDFDAAHSSCLERGGCISAFDPPTVASTTPANQATDVAVSTSLSVSFSKAMDKTSFGRPTISPPVALSELQWSADGTSFVTQPLVSLAYATTYTVSVSGRSTDSAQLAAGTSFSFTTQPAPDTTAPTLVASTPSNGLQGVDVATRLSLSFSEPMNPASLDVTTAPLVGLGTATWGADGKSVTFPAPLDDWQASTTYVVQVNASDVAGNALSGTKSFSFKTAQAVVVDTTAPTVVGTTPTPFAGGVVVQVNPSVTFSEAVRPAGATLVLSPDAGCVPALDVTNTRLSCNSLAPLEPLTTYTVTVPTSVLDVAGNALAQEFSFQFQTGAVPDTTRPTIVAVSPDGGTGWPVRQPMSVTFSEAMDQASVQQALTVTQPSGVPVSFAWSNAGKTVTATPSADFANSQTVTWQVAATAADLAGNTLLSTQQFSFTVVPDTTPPTVASTSPANLAGTVDVKVNFGVTFSEPMRVAGATLVTTPDAGCAPLLDSSGTHLTCENAVDLLPLTTYVVSVPTSAADLAGNNLASAFTYQFTTGSVPDTVRPTIVSVAPVAGSAGWPINQPMSVTFSEAMDQGRVQLAFNYVLPTSGSVTFSWSADGKTVTMTPTTSFGYAESVKWQMSATAADLAGNTLLSSQQYTFTTELGPTLLASVSPDGGVGYPLRQPISATFVNVMDQPSTEAALTVTQPAGVTLTYSWSADGKTVTATPTADFPYGQVVKWQVGATATDTAGSAMLVTQQFSFRVLQSLNLDLIPVSAWHTHNGIGGTGAFVGDNAANENYRGFYVFTLPSTAVSILSTSLTATQSLVAGAPFSGGQSLAIYVESIPFTDPVSNDDAVVTPFCVGSALQCVAAFPSQCVYSDVLSTSGSSVDQVKTLISTKLDKMVRAGLGQPGRTFALRLRRGYLSSFISGPCGDYYQDGDGIGDYVRFYDANDGAAKRPVLNIQYTAP